MKTTKIIGKKVIDSNANEIGKVHDIDLDIKSSSINSITVNSGEISLRKIVYDVKPSNILQVGDYILLNITKSELSSDDDEKDDEIPDIEIVNPEDIK